MYVTKDSNADGDRYDSIDVPLVSTGPGGDYTKKWKDKNGLWAWKEVESLIIGTAIVSLTSGLIIGAIVVCFF